MTVFRNHSGKAESTIDKRASDLDPEQVLHRIDMRSMRRTNRTDQLSIKTTPEVGFQFRSVAVRDGLTLSELMEAALVAYERIQARKHPKGSRRVFTADDLAE